MLEESAQRHNEQFRSEIHMIESFCIDMSIKNVVSLMLYVGLWCGVCCCVLLGSIELIDAVI